VSQRSDVSSASGSDSERARLPYIIRARELVQAIALLTLTLFLFVPLIICTGLIRCTAWALRLGSDDSGPSRNYWTR
jgi:hypothetical protein